MVSAANGEVGLVYPPFRWVGAAVASVLVGAALLLGDGRTLHLIGYALAALVTLSCVSIYRVVDNRRRGPSYSPRPVWGRVAVTTLVVGIAIAGVHVWRFATLVAR